MSSAGRAGGKPAMRFPLWPTGGVLALDLAGVTGWCYGPPEQPLPAGFGEWELPLIGGRGAKGAGLQNKLAPFIKRYRPVKLVLESPLPLPAQTHFNSAYQQFGLGYLAHAEAWRGRAAVVEVDVHTARREVMGITRMSRKTIKREVVRFCWRRGVKVQSDHAADAAVLWWWNRPRTLGIAPAAGPLFQWEDAA